MNRWNSLVIFCSWSGGKDSSLALWHGLKLYGRVDFLFSMLSEDGIHSRSHGLTKELLQRQAKNIGIQLVTKSSTWEEYEDKFIEFLSEYAVNGIGIFGDIDLEEHKDWVDRVCSIKNVTAIEPLWKRDREELLKEFLNLGFKAKIVSIRKGIGIDDCLGLDLDYSLIERFRNIGIDISGENGEYHTFVYAGPIFRKKIDFEIGDIIEREKNYVLLLK